MVGNLLNPKVAVFYLSCIILLIALAWNALLVHVLTRVTAALARPRVNPVVIGSSGAVLAGVGAQP